MPDKYKGIPEHILRNKADFGTHVHEAIEAYENGKKYSLNPFEQLCFEQYLKLKVEHDIQPIEQEKLVHYKDKYAGRLDMIANVKGIKSLVDIKTTSKLDYEALAIQLGYYQLAEGTKFDKHYCLWLPKKDLGRLAEIEPMPEDELLEWLDKYEKSKN